MVTKRLFQRCLNGYKKSCFHSVFIVTIVFQRYFNGLSMMVFSTVKIKKMSRNGYKSQRYKFEWCFDDVLSVTRKLSCFNSLEETICERCLSGEKKGCFVVKKGVSKVFFNSEKKIVSAVKKVFPQCFYRDKKGVKTVFQW